MMPWKLQLGWPRSWDIGHCRRGSSGLGQRLKSQFLDSWCQDIINIEHCWQPYTAYREGSLHLDQRYVQFSSQSKHSLTSESETYWWPYQPLKCNLSKEYLKIIKVKEWKNKHLYLTIAQHLALSSSSPKSQESYPVFPPKYTLSQFPHQMGTLFNYWGFVAMIIMGTAKISAKGSLLHPLSLFICKSQKAGRSHRVSHMEDHHH